MAVVPFAPRVISIRCRMKLGLVGRGAGRKIARPREWRRGVLDRGRGGDGVVDDLQVSVVWVVIVACKVKGFGGLCHVWSMSDVEEEENESVR